MHAISYIYVFSTSPLISWHGRDAANFLIIFRILETFDEKRSQVVFGNYASGRRVELDGVFWFWCFWKEQYLFSRESLRTSRSQSQQNIPVICGGNIATHFRSLALIMSNMRWWSSVTSLYIAGNSSGLQNKNAENLQLEKYQ